MRTFLLIVIGLVAIGSDRALPPAPTAILGWWHGTSTCTRATWNASCNDETVLYEFVPDSTDSTQIVVRASKIVGGKPEPMGDLNLRYAADSSAWNGDFSNGRVDIRWTYWIKADTLFGRLVLRPALQVARQVIAWRGKGGA